MRDRHEKELSDPLHFLEELLYYEGMHLKENKAFDNAQSDLLHLLLNQNKKQYLLLERELIAYWNAHGLRVEVEREQFLTFLRAYILMFTNAEWIGKQEFPEFFRHFIADGVTSYITVESISQK